MRLPCLLKKYTDSMTLCQCEKHGHYTQRVHQRIDERFITRLNAVLNP